MKKVYTNFLLSALLLANLDVIAANRSQNRTQGSNRNQSVSRNNVQNTRRPIARSRSSQSMTKYSDGFDLDRRGNSNDRRSNTNNRRVNDSRNSDRQFYNNLSGRRFDDDMRYNNSSTRQSNSYSKDDELFDSVQRRMNQRRARDDYDIEYGARRRNNYSNQYLSDSYNEEDDLSYPQRRRSNTPVELSASAEYILQCLPSIPELEYLKNSFYQVRIPMGEDFEELDQLVYDIEIRIRGLIKFINRMAWLFSPNELQTSAVANQTSSTTSSLENKDTNVKQNDNATQPPENNNTESTSNNVPDNQNNSVAQQLKEDEDFSFDSIIYKLKALPPEEVIGEICKKAGLSQGEYNDLMRIGKLSQELGENLEQFSKIATDDLLNSLKGKQNFSDSSSLQEALDPRIQEDIALEKEKEDIRKQREELETKQRELEAKQKASNIAAQKNQVSSEKIDSSTSYKNSAEQEPNVDLPDEELEEQETDAGYAGNVTSDSNLLVTAEQPAKIAPIKIEVSNNKNATNQNEDSNKVRGNTSKSDNESTESKKDSEQLTSAANSQNQNSPANDKSEESPKENDKTNDPSQKQNDEGNNQDQPTVENGSEDKGKTENPANGDDDSNKQQTETGDSNNSSKINQPNANEESKNAEKPSLGSKKSDKEVSGNTENPQNEQENDESTKDNEDVSNNARSQSTQNESDQNKNSGELNNPSTENPQTETEEPAPKDDAIPDKIDDSNEEEDSQSVEDDNQKKEQDEVVTSDESEQKQDETTEPSKQPKSEDKVISEEINSSKNKSEEPAQESQDQEPFVQKNIAKLDTLTELVDEIKARANQFKKDGLNDKQGKQLKKLNEYLQKIDQQKSNPQESKLKDEVLLIKAIIRLYNQLVSGKAPSITELQVIPNWQGDKFIIDTYLGILDVMLAQVGENETATAQIEKFRAMFKVASTWEERRTAFQNAVDEYARSVEDSSQKTKYESFIEVLPK